MWAKSYKTLFFMTILHLFSGYNSFSMAAHARSHDVISVDIKNYKNCPSSTINIDFLDFDFLQYSRHTFNFLLIGFPCTTFSKASGNFHFKNNCPITSAAHNAILMIDKLKEILEYFDCDFIIENPTSALFSNYYFKSVFYISNYNLIRVHQYLYGHITFKQTDLLTSKNMLWLDNNVYRVNGKNAVKKFDNLTLKERQSYPIEFCNKILDFMEL